MTPEEAGASLRDDPTFALMSREEQETEAELLLGSDDPLEIALAIEAALSAPAATAKPVEAAGMEPCRADSPCGGREPIAGNGRCLSCGAMRAAAAVAPASAQTPVAAPPEPRAPVASPAAILAREGGYIAAFKEASGMFDADIGALVGLKRPTVQAVLSGRRPERLDEAQEAALVSAARDQVLRLMAFAGRGGWRPGCENDEN